MRRPERLPAWIEDYPEPTVAVCIIFVIAFFYATASLSPMKIGI